MYRALPAARVGAAMLPMAACVCRAISVPPKDAAPAMNPCAKRSGAFQQRRPIMQEQQIAIHISRKVGSSLEK
jgi:hypothetical protein